MTNGGGEGGGMGGNQKAAMFSSADFADPMGGDSQVREMLLTHW